MKRCLIMGEAGGCVKGEVGIVIALRKYGCSCIDGKPGLGVPLVGGRTGIEPTGGGGANGNIGLPRGGGLPS
jgi:hypothetical protein